MSVNVRRGKKNNEYPSPSIEKPITPCQPIRRRRDAIRQTPDANPRPGGMREAIKSGAPRALAVLGLSEKIPEMI